MSLPALLVGMGALHCGAEEDIIARRVPVAQTAGSDAGGRLETGGRPTALGGASFGGRIDFGGAFPGGNAGRGGEAAGGSDQGGSSGLGGTDTGGRSGATTCEEAAFVATAQSSLPTHDACGAWAARRSFAHALCACGDVDLTRGLVTTAVDSSDTTRDLEGSAAVGVNGDLRRAEYLRLDGSLTVAGDLSMRANGSVDVAGDLRLAGSLTAAGPISVGRDAWFTGNASSLSVLEVERDLYTGPRSRLMSFGPPRVGGRRVEASFTVGAPCACEASDLLDVPGIVSDGLERNDNARIGLGLDALVALDPDDPPPDLTLSCGRFALAAISGDAPVTVRVEGPTVLFVDGDVELGKSFVLELAEGATLDWFIRGGVTLARGARLGDALRPGALRVYTTAPFELSLPGTELVAMNLYAPLADVTVGSAGNIYGALFANNVTSSGTLLLDYDVSVLQSNAACESLAPSTCSRCDDCAGAGANACVGGVCGACGTDADCCFPLVCSMGQCAPLRTDD